MYDFHSPNADDRELVADLPEGYLIHNEEFWTAFWNPATGSLIISTDDSEEAWDDLYTQEEVEAILKRI